MSMPLTTEMPIELLALKPAPLARISGTMPRIKHEVHSFSLPICRQRSHRTFIVKTPWPSACPPAVSG